MDKIKSKFVIGERVLCFEPDQTKARVLYDAKVSFIFWKSLFHRKIKFNFFFFI